MRSIVDESDAITARPIDRATLLDVDEGVLVTCTATHCDWQGLFPKPVDAYQAAETHWFREQSRPQGDSRGYHCGDSTFTVVRLLDEATAQVLDNSRLGLTVEENRLRTQDGDVREPEFPRTTGDAGDLVGRGDLIDRLHRDDAMVCDVAETRSCGLPTWSVRYVEQDVEIESAGRHDYYWINECIAQDSAVYQSYGEDPLSTPALEVIGTGEHQADFSELLEGSA